MKRASPAKVGPYLSVVVTSRNDDHGGDLLGRMQVFMNCIREQCGRHGLPAEMVVVEWNPPHDRPRLAEALEWPAYPGAPPVRIIEVPPAIHRRFRYAERLPLFQMAAKNVGIRRAEGVFVLATNVDVLLSGQLVRFLGQRKLSTARMYRVDRYDVSPDLPAELSAEEVLEYCRSHIMRVHRRVSTVGADGRISRIYPRLPQRAKQLLKSAIQGKDLPLTRLHTNACGDFTLLAQDRWHALRGYAELPGRSLHVDSLLCFTSHYSGTREQALRPPRLVFHIEHSRNEGDTNFSQGDRAPVDDADQIPSLDKGQVRAWAVKMRRERQPLILNEEDWGLANEELPEVTIE